MKQMLLCLAICMTIIASCVKEQTLSKSFSSEMASRSTFTDDFYVSKNLKPLFHRIEAATMTTIFSDSVYNNFGGSLTHICFQFSNPDIDYSHLKLTIKSASGEQSASYNAAATTINDGIKELVFNNYDNGLLISPGWSMVVLKAKISGNVKDSFHVTIPDGGITYRSINEAPGTVVGLPVSTPGLKIK
jgi:hypothetical protein